MRNVVEDADGGRVIGVALGEFELEVEDSTFVGGFFGASDVGVPCEQVGFEWTRSDAHSGDFLVLNFSCVLHKSLLGICLQFIVERSPEERRIMVPASFLHRKRYDKR